MDTGKGGGNEEQGACPDQENGSHQQDQFKGGDTIPGSQPIFRSWIPGFYGRHHPPPIPAVIPLFPTGRK